MGGEAGAEKWKNWVGGGRERQVLLLLGFCWTRGRLELYHPVWAVKVCDIRCPSIVLPQQITHL